MTWRSIEIDPPKMGQKVWLSSHEQRYAWNIEWSPAWMKAHWTHWSPCEPPADLPPRPKTAFEEWCDVHPYNPVTHEFHLSCLHEDYRVHETACEMIFNAGYEAGKAKG